MINVELVSVVPDPFVGISRKAAQPRSHHMFKTPANSYTALETLGNGGAGTVFKVEDENGMPWAIKVLNPNTASEDKIKRFRIELAFCQQNTHPNIVKSYDSGFHKMAEREMPFYVMRYCSGTLRTLMKAGLAPEVAVSRFNDLLDGLQEAHSKKIWHRDLKPENILYDSGNDRLMLADFGIAHFSEEFLVAHVETRDNFHMGNFQYAAPEQREHNGIVDHRTDIFSLGLILNEMFTGKLALGHGYPTIASVAPSYAYLDTIVTKMLHTRLDLRPQNISEIKQLLASRHALLETIVSLSQWPSWARVAASAGLLRIPNQIGRHSKGNRPPFQAKSATVPRKSATPWFRA
jgi:serine/threonine protein kinase